MSSRIERRVFFKKNWVNQPASIQSNGEIWGEEFIIIANLKPKKECVMHCFVVNANRFRSIGIKIKIDWNRLSFTYLIQPGEFVSSFFYFPVQNVWFVVRVANVQFH